MVKIISDFVEMRTHHANSKTTLCYKNENYSNMTNSKRTEFYKNAIRNVLKKCEDISYLIVDVGCGSDAILSLCALECGAKNILSLEISKDASKYAANRIQKFMNTKYRQCTEIDYYMEKDGIYATVINSDAKNIDATLFQNYGLIILLHELLDDIASREDACDIISEIYKKIPENTNVISIPQRAYTIARATNLLNNIDDKLSGIINRQKTIIHLDHLIPFEWFTEDGKVIEEINFLSRPCNITNYTVDIKACDVITIYLVIDFGDLVYEVSPGEPWRHIIVQGSSNNIKLKMTMEKNVQDEISYVFCLNESFFRMTWIDILEAAMGDNGKIVKRDPWGDLSLRNV